jgi:hypothetical protein
MATPTCCGLTVPKGNKSMQFGVLHAAPVARPPVMLIDCFYEVGGVLRAGVRGRSVDRSEILMGPKADGCVHEKLAAEA